MYKYQGIGILMILAFLMVGLFKEAPDIFLSIVLRYDFGNLSRIRANS